MKIKKLYERYKQDFINECEKHGLKYDEIMESHKGWGGPQLFFMISKWDEPTYFGDGNYKDTPLKPVYKFELIDGKMVLTYRDDGVEFFDNRIKY